MNWLAQIDGYCERTDAAYWSEPINALTNLAFVIGAAVMWRRTNGQPLGRALCVILALIGIGSYLFHTHATAWAALADVAPIGVFILVYLFAVHRDVLGLKRRIAMFATAMFIPYAAITVPVLNATPFVRISNFYWTVPILLFAYAFALRKRLPDTTEGFAIGGALLCLSIALRSLDEILCAAFPIGTHFMWHCLNAAMLTLMIHVYSRHMLATRSL
ncbi:ceramidase domain-containing protein [Yoonia maritima]|uniref:ceramidase domain-containing protein n=1 Tax=Yoonia maritima TaxID=1435347 RepID=UPI0037353EDB